jgi:tetratricopeptide (TPR) repeat protein
MDFYFLGMACANKGWTPEYMTQASRFFERALASDPSNVDAMVGAAFADYVRGSASLPDERAALLAGAEATLNKALSLSPEHALAHFGLARVQAQTNRAPQSIAECERALLLDRNLAGAHTIIGVAKWFIGRGEETEAHINDALRLSPRDTNAYVWLAIAGAAKLWTGKDEEAITLLRRAIETSRNYPFAHFWLGATLANLGRTEEAQDATQAGLALDPSFTVAHQVAQSDNPIFLAQRARVFDGMRKAGVPEE